MSPDRGKCDRWFEESTAHLINVNQVDDRRAFSRSSAVTVRPYRFVCPGLSAADFVSCRGSWVAAAFRVLAYQKKCNPLEPCAWPRVAAAPQKRQKRQKRAAQLRERSFSKLTQEGGSNVSQNSSNSNRICGLHSIGGSNRAITHGSKRTYQITIFASIHRLR